MRFFAAASAVRISPEAVALETLRQIGESDPRFAPRAVQLAARRLALAAAQAWHNALAKNPKTIHLAILTAGAIGDPALIPWLIDRMTQPALACHAGEAFSLITGIDLAEGRLELKGPPPPPLGPPADPEEVKKFLGPASSLPLPDPALISKWWSDNRGRFPAGVRHLLGKPMTPESLEEALRAGRQRQRAQAALELAIRQPGKPLFEVRAPGFRQKQGLNT